jgi:hypothetical protein
MHASCKKAGIAELAPVMQTLRSVATAEFHVSLAQSYYFFLSV